MSNTWLALDARSKPSRSCLMSITYTEFSDTVHKRSLKESPFQPSLFLCPRLIYEIVTKRSIDWLQRTLSLRTTLHKKVNLMGLQKLSGCQDFNRQTSILKAMIHKDDGFASLAGSPGLKLFKHFHKGDGLLGRLGAASNYLCWEVWGWPCTRSCKKVFTHWIFRRILLFACSPLRQVL